MIRIKLPGIVVVGALLGLTAMLMALMPQSAFAAVGSGGTGGSGSGGGPHTSHGYGWYIFGIDSAGPKDFQNGNTWSSVQSTCRAESAQQVVMYIVQRSSGGVGNARVYDDVGWSEGWTGFHGNDGGNWRNRSQADDMFKTSIPASERVGYAIGSNVGWFCYNPGSFSIAPYSYVTATTSGSPAVPTSWGSAGRTINVRPGTTVYFRHQVQNSGNLSASFQGRRDTKHNSSSWSNGSWTNRSTSASSTATMGSSFYSVNVPSNAANGTQYCQRYNTDRTATNNGTDRQSTAACATVRYEWSLTPTATVSAENRPGQTLTWTHRITNNGDPTIGTVTYRGQNQPSLGTSIAGTWDVSAGLPGSGPNNYRQQSTTLPITQGHVGNNLCRRTTVTPSAYNNSNQSVSGNACRLIPYNYDLTPSITGGVPDAAEAGQQVPNIRGTITNDGPTKSYQSNIRYIRIVNPTNRSGSTATGAAACPRYGSSGGNCAIIRVTGDDNRTFNHSSGNSGGAITAGTTYNQPVATDILPDSLRPGDVVCYALAVTGYDQDNGAAKSRTRYSDIEDSQCLKIGKNPKVQVWGGNVSVGQATVGGSVNANASIRTSTTTKATGLTYGSWGEYALFAPRIISGTASASGLNEGNSATSQNQWSRLTFTGNNSTPSAFGSYTYGMSSLPNIAAQFPITSTTPSVNGTLDVVARANGVLGNTIIGDTATGPLTITGSGQVQSGHWLVINKPNADITITHNIRYHTGDLTSTSQIPQIIIIARNITIASGVSQVDAWLVAGQNVATCNEGGDATTLQATYRQDSARLTVGMCSSPLTINGPVIANKLYLRRTAGSGTGAQSGDPAETINFRADAYLWAQRNRQNQNPSGTLRTVSIQELPPRY